MDVADLELETVCVVRVPHMIAINREAAGSVERFMCLGCGQESMFAPFAFRD